MSRPRYVAAAERHLRSADEVMMRLVQSVGPCLLVKRPDPFEALVGTVISQQISTKAARAIGDRLRAQCHKTGVTPKAIAKLTPEELRSCGLSGSKQRSIQALSQRVLAGELDLARLPRQRDEAISEALLPTPGIGPWSVHMFLMFGLNRPDVLPTGDYGIRVAVQMQYALAELPKHDVIEQIAAPWRPYRTVASWYLWRSLG